MLVILCYFWCHCGVIVLKTWTTCASFICRLRYALTDFWMVILSVCFDESCHTLLTKLASRCKRRLVSGLPLYKWGVRTRFSETTKRLVHRKHFIVLNQQSKLLAYLISVNLSWNLGLLLTGRLSVELDPTERFCRWPGKERGGEKWDNTPNPGITHY